MTRQYKINLVIFVAVLLALGVFANQKGIAVWPFSSEKQDLAAILGSAGEAWIDRAEVVAWAPDPNYKPQSYYAVVETTEKEFRAWAAAQKLDVSDVRTIPAGVLTLPKDVHHPRWLGGTSVEDTGLDAQGAVGSAAMWARFQHNVMYVVVNPEY